MSMVLINNSSETFTPTVSGAIATWLWECCQVAPGEKPWVITRTSPAPTYAHERTIFLEYPPIGDGKWETLLWRAERKLNSWRHLRQKSYALRVAQAIIAGDLKRSALVLHNDPEMAVFLRERFPQATIVHHFHNHLECKPTFRRRYRDAKIISTAVSAFTARWIENYYNLPADSVQSIHNGVDTLRFSPGPREHQGRCVLNFVGRTGREKGPDLLLKAAKTLAARGCDFAVQIVGSNHWGRFELDDYQRELQALAAELETGGITVTRLGHVDRKSLPEAIRSADVHVVPSRWDEAFGLTTLEGMACGLATVGSRTGGTPEIIGQSGFLFERDSADALADQLEPLVRDDQIRRKYARLARERALEFAWARTWAAIQAAAGVA